MLRPRRFWLMGIVAFIAYSASAQSYLSGFGGADLATGLSLSTSFCIAPDGTIYICQQSGTMLVWKEESGLLSDQFFATSPLTVDPNGERGLLGAAVDPNFAANRFIYIYYTATFPAIHNRVSRFTANADGSLALAGSEVVLLDLNSLGAATDNGGAMRFGADGRLYVAVGDNSNNATPQSITTLLGKILRIGTTPATVILPDNPTSFPGVAGSPTGNNRAIWAVGLRNPYTLAVHPISGRMFINDVGQTLQEEINDGMAGKNYGWPGTEGDFAQPLFPNFTRPFFAYPHSGGPLTGFAVIGGAFNAPPVSPYPASYYGDYFFGDYISDWVKVIDIGTRVVGDLVTGASGVVDIRMDAQGRLIYLARDLNRLIRVNYAPLFAPVITVPPAGQAVCVAETVKLSVSVAANPAPTFVWHRNGMAVVDGGNVSGASTPTLTITAAQPANTGGYDCIVRNTQGSITTDVATLTVAAPGGYSGDTIQVFTNIVVNHLGGPLNICWFDFDGSDVIDGGDVAGMVAALMGA